jgi:tetratricopeptide (TPR) repeat protein
MSEGSDGGRDSRPAGERATAHDPQDAPNRPETADPGTCTGAGDDIYSLYRRGMSLLGNGSSAAAAQLLERAAAAEPESRSVREGLARAQFDAGWYAEAAGNFQRIVDASPSDDYAQFGLGLALARTGDHGGAAEHLALAVAMRPDLRHYTEALRSVRATLSARSRLREESAD